ncbi:MAG: presenilin family intramembrane aspartyl protease [Patescibacteria group bacterium]|nr:presenilin family intramembrane aspartyl protease [Patescibacteria group bacterium]
MKNIKDLKLNFLAQTIIVFLVMSFLSLATANTMTTGKVAYTSEPVHSVYVPPPPVSSPAPPYEPAEIDIFQFLASFFIATSLILFFLKLYKGKFLFEFFFSGVVIFGAQGPIGILFEKTSAFFVAVAIVILRFAYPRIWTQNLAIIFGIAGISASLGMSIKPLIVLSIIVLLSVYDIIAVYKTRHMIKLFKGMAKKGAVLALIIPKSFPKWFNKFEVIKFKNKNEFIFLGTGDLALPLLFAVSVFSLGVQFSLAIIFGAIVGFIADHLIFVTQKEKKPIPALPAIALFSIMGYAVGFYL